MLVDAMRSISLCAGILWIDDRHLFLEDADAQIAQRRSITYPIAIIVVVIVIVLFSIGRHAAKELYEARLNQLFMPLAAHPGDVLRFERIKAVVVDAVSSPDKKIRLHLHDCGKRGIAEIFVRAGVDAVATGHTILGYAKVKGRKVHSRDLDEARCSCAILSVQGAKRAGLACLNRILVRAKDQSVLVAYARLPIRDRRL